MHSTSRLAALAIALLLGVPRAIAHEPMPNTSRTPPPAAQRLRIPMLSDVCEAIQQAFAQGFDRIRPALEFTLAVDVWCAGQLTDAASWDSVRRHIDTGEDPDELVRTCRTVWPALDSATKGRSSKEGAGCVFVELQVILAVTSEENARLLGTSIESEGNLLTSRDVAVLERYLDKQCGHDIRDLLIPPSERGRKAPPRQLPQRTLCELLTMDFRTSPRPGGTDGASNQDVQATADAFAANVLFVWPRREKDRGLRGVDSAAISFTCVAGQWKTQPQE